MEYFDILGVKSSGYLSTLKFCFVSAAQFPDDVVNIVNMLANFALRVLGRERFAVVSTRVVRQTKTSSSSIREDLESCRAQDLLPKSKCTICRESLS